MSCVPSALQTSDKVHLQGRWMSGGPVSYRAICEYLGNGKCRNRYDSCNPVSTMGKTFDEVTIDRVSKAKNLIAREGAHYHIIPAEVGGRIPKPGEVWRVREIKHYRHPKALLPVEYVRTVRDYQSLHPGSKYAPVLQPNKPNPKKTRRKASHPKRRMARTTSKNTHRYTSSLNKLLSRKNL